MFRLYSYHQECKQCIRLSAEFKHLKECSLSIEGFPVGKEVFGR